MTTVSVTKKNPQPDQSSADSEATQPSVKGAAPGSGNPLRIKAKPSTAPSVKVPPVVAVKPREEVVVKGSAYQVSLGSWQDQIIAATATASKANTIAAKGDDSHHPRNRSRSRERKHKFSVKKVFRKPSCSPERKSPKLEKCPCKSPEKKHPAQESCSKTPVRIHPKKRDCKPKPPCDVIVPPVVPCPPPVEKKCTECNPEGDMCRPITIRDVFALFKNEKHDKHIRYFAHKLLSSIKCPPAQVGREFWSDFDYNPVVYSAKPTETCHCGSKRAECKCVVSNLKVECEGVKLEEFNFHAPNVEAKNGEVVLYPLGCSCVPSPLRICEPAKFTIYAVKSHLHGNWCCDKCKHPDACTHQVSKGDEEAINYAYIIKWAYRRLKEGDCIDEDVKKMLCCALRALKDKLCELPPKLQRKYKYIHRKLAEDRSEHCHRKPASPSSSCRRRSPSRSSKKCPRSRSRSSSTSSSSRSRSHSRSSSRSRSHSPKNSCSPSREQSCTPRRRSCSRRRSTSRSSSASSHSHTQTGSASTCSPRRSVTCSPRRRSRSRSHSPRSRSHSRSSSRSRSSSHSRSSTPSHKSCHECGYPRGKCNDTCPTKIKRCQPKAACPKPKKECRVPVVKESPFAVFHVTGQWLCETVPCTAACNDEAKGTRYRIVLNERDLEHANGGQVCEGWGLFTSKRYSSVYFKMCPQFLPFAPLTPAVIPDCGC